MDQDRELPFEVHEPPALDGVPPITPTVPPSRERFRGPSVPFRIFAPAFLLIAAIVGIERISMVLVVAESLPMWVRMGGLAVFCAIVATVSVSGAVIFARHYGK